MHAEHRPDSSDMHRYAAATLDLLRQVASVVGGGGVHHRCLDDIVLLQAEAQQFVERLPACADAGEGMGATIADG